MRDGFLPAVAGLANEAFVCLKSCRSLFIQDDVLPFNQDKNARGDPFVLHVSDGVFPLETLRPAPGEAAISWTTENSPGLPVREQPTRNLSADSRPGSGASFRRR